MIRTLKNVPLLECLSVAQIQRMTDLMSEEIYGAGAVIIDKGVTRDHFYMIVHGTVECLEDGCEVKTLKDHDYFGDQALLEEFTSPVKIVAKTETKVLYITKQAFDLILGPLVDIIASDQLKREAIAAATHSAQVPHRFSDMTIYGIVTTDVLGTLFMGTFGPRPSTGVAERVEPNVTVRSFLLSQVERKALDDSLVRFVEAVKTILAAPSENTTVLIPRPMSFI